MNDLGHPNAGHCHDRISHEVACCESEIKTKDESCGWIYDTHGKNVICPSGMIGVGFCGTNNGGDCNSGKNYIGIRCCQVESAVLLTDL